MATKVLRVVAINVLMIIAVGSWLPETLSNIIAVAGISWIDEVLELALEKQPVIFKETSKSVSKNKVENPLSHWS